MSHEFDEDEWQNIQSRLDEAVKAERERIIKLLARLYPDVDWDLALDNGENK